MKNLLKIALKTIPWQTALLLVWNFCLPRIQEQVKKTPKKWDDIAVDTLDKLIHDLCNDHDSEAPTA